MKTEWGNFQEYLYSNNELNLQIDISRVNLPENYLEEMKSRIQRVFLQIREMERGGIANQDEQRMVGHYWLSDPDISPTAEIGNQIKLTLDRIKDFTRKVHQGVISGQTGRTFRNILVVGIGGSSLGTRFVSDALRETGQPCKLYFIDNTDPDAMDRIFDELRGKMDETLTIVISKSGGTVETRNGMEEVRYFYEKQELDFSRHTVSITQAGSKLDKICIKEGWLDSFPMWEWVGGRTSVLSAVGLLPLALQGIDIDGLLEGARICNSLTRKTEVRSNPAALLALAWDYLTGGKGGKQMVVLPYKDRLELFAKYLQQLVMESLGKEKDLDGKTVHQGLTVYGNKGSSDQHSYLQQLLEGPDNFFLIFIEVLKDREGNSLKIAEESTSGDYLHAFLLGTRNAITQKGKSSITITVKEINAKSIGCLIALFERIVSIYALLVNINAYHQPAVEMSKKGAHEVIRIKNLIVSILSSCKGQGLTIEEIAQAIRQNNGIENSKINQEIIYKVLQHLAANRSYGIEKIIDSNEFRSLYKFK
ncbi:glucose-6-phosphate isomerase [Dehalobacter sp. DCM]|uniref:glucose-6-phosphate isomerase n=1 Tax=Dehalobacter sp. DCM TaxID=2907827 RepID=UPI00308164D6|nr:glucose-6-phosphate isomerase [Dehalobacter sp. DCM]